MVFLLVQSYLPELPGLSARKAPCLVYWVMGSLSVPVTETPEERRSASPERSKLRDPKAQKLRKISSVRWLETINIQNSSNLGLPPPTCPAVACQIQPSPTKMWSSWACGTHPRAPASTLEPPSPVSWTRNQAFFYIKSNLIHWSQNWWQLQIWILASKLVAKKVHEPLLVPSFAPNLLAFRSVWRLFPLWPLPLWAPRFSGRSCHGPCLAIELGVFPNCGVFSHDPRPGCRWRYPGARFATGSWPPYQTRRPRSAASLRSRTNGSDLPPSVKAVEKR